MTKLEAWQAWSATAGTDSLSTEFTLENSSHGKAFSFAWDAAHEACAKVCEEVERKATHQPPMVSQGCQACAAAIRARRQG